MMYIAQNSIHDMEQAGRWKMTVLQMPVLENGGTTNAGTGNCRYWKMPVLENDGTGK